jgi:hypothetical protein
LTLTPLSFAGWLVAILACIFDGLLLSTTVLKMSLSSSDFFGWGLSSFMGVRV